MIPQLIILTISILALGGELAKHGEPKKPEKYNFWARLIAFIIYSTILYFGGFWNPLFNG